jgi:hypothetical protein
MVNFRLMRLSDLPAAVTSHVEHDRQGSAITSTTIHAQGVNGEIFTRTLAIGEVFRPASLGFELVWCLVSAHVTVTAHGTAPTQSFQTTYFD